MDQLKGIFTGKYTNWKQVGGKNQKIIVINRAQGSGTRKAFESDVLKGESAIKAQEQDSSGTVQKMIAATPGSISYLAFPYLNKDVQKLSIDNVKPNAKNVENLQTGIKAAVNKDVADSTTKDNYEVSVIKSAIKTVDKIHNYYINKIILTKFVNIS